MIFIHFHMTTLLLAVFHIVLGLVVLVVAKALLNLLTPYRVDKELTVRDNPALGLALTGYLAGVVILYIAASRGTPLPVEAGARALAGRVFEDLAYVFAGILGMNVSRIFVDRFLLPRASIYREIIQDKNPGAGAVEFGTFVANAIITAGAIGPENGGPLPALAFFGLGQVVLAVFAWIYQFVAGYDVQGEIDKNNPAAGLAFGLTLIALGILVLAAIRGEFFDWRTNLSFFAVDSIIGLILLIGLRLVTNYVILPGTTIAEEIVRDHNSNAALVEGTVAIGIASVILFLL